jgi:hypothetical protein
VVCIIILQVVIKFIQEIGRVDIIVNPMVINLSQSHI